MGGSQGAVDVTSQLVEGFINALRVLGRMRQPRGGTGRLHPVRDGDKLLCLAHTG